MVSVSPLFWGFFPFLFCGVTYFKFYIKIDTFLCRCIKYFLPVDGSMKLFPKVSFLCHEFSSHTKCAP